LAVDAYSLTDHLVQFTYSAGGLRVWRSFLRVWVVWNERNLRVFGNTENNVHKLLDKVKFFFLSVVADDGCYFSYEFSSLVVELIAMFGHRLIVTLFMLFI
jgi:hypothetical protein